MILSLAVYFLLLMGLAAHSRRKTSIQAQDYFLGNRRLGVFALAMTTAATYVSASSFIGGPGIAYSRGLGWVFLAAVQYPVSLLLLGLLGRQVRSLGQQHQLYDLADYIRWRYQSRRYGQFCALLVAVVLLLGLMVALMGGSRLLQGAFSGSSAAGQNPGLAYGQALLIFSLALGAYTLLGGLRAVVLSDILQGSWMLLASCILLVLLWRRAGGASGLAEFAAAEPALFRADGGGTVPLSYTLNFVLLVGLGMAANPISFARLLAFDPRKSLRSSILIAIIVVGLLVLLPHFIGFLGRLVLPGLEQPDQLMGRLARSFQSAEAGWPGKLFSGMLVSAMLAAIMSTADSALHTLGLTIYRHLLPRRLSQGLWCQKADAERRHFQLSRLFSALAVVLVALLALYPPRLLVSLNLYALGSTQVALFWPLVLGLFSRRPGAACAWAATLAGLGCYLLLNLLLPNFGGVRLLPFSLLLGLAAYFGTYFLAPAGLRTTETKRT